jgi:hypothetical protein
MPIDDAAATLGSYIFAGDLSLVANNITCTAISGLATSPDWVGYTARQSTVEPVTLVSVTASLLVIRNLNAAAVAGNVFAVFGHSVIR